MNHIVEFMISTALINLQEGFSCKYYTLMRPLMNYQNATPYTMKHSSMISEF